MQDPAKDELLEASPEAKEFNRKKEQQFHDKIQGKEDKANLKTQKKQQKGFKEGKKVGLSCS
jgi:hypothetical protein